MPYCTQQDLVERFGEDELVAVAPAAEGDGLDAARIARACEDAAGEIDGYLEGAGYAVPLANPPRVVTGFAADIARYRLHDDHASEAVARRYEEAVRFLRSVAAGQVRLGAHMPGNSTGAAEVVQAGRKVFGGGLR